MGESTRGRAAASNARGDKFATQKIRRGEERISFRDLARFVLGKKATAIVAQRTGKHERTVKRWFARGARVPDHAVTFVIGELIRRYG